MRTLDPKWLSDGWFDLSLDPKPTRTLQIRDHLRTLLGTGALLLKKHESYGHTSGYYIRETDDGPPVAQYLMSIDHDHSVLSLGLSIEKGEEGRDAASGRTMNRHAWDWGRLATLRAPSLKEALAAIAKGLGRPLGLFIGTHRIGRSEGDDEEREEMVFVVTDGHVLRRACPSSFQEVVDRLAEIDGRRDWWADVWIFCDFGPTDVARMTPGDAAKILHAFKPLRRILSGK